MEGRGEGRKTPGHQSPSATYVQRPVLLAGAGGLCGCKSKPPPRGRCLAHAPGLEVLAPISPQGHTVRTETFGFPRDGVQGSSGHTLTECGDQGQQRGMWTDQSFVAAGESGLGPSFREWVEEVPILNPRSKRTRWGNVLVALGTAGLRDDPLPQATADSWRLPASRADSQSVLLCSAARERPPEKGGTRAGGHRVWS